MSNSEVHTESQTEPFIWTPGVDCSNSITHDQVEVLSYCKYSLLVLPVVGIEPATSRWLHSEVFSNQTPYPLCYVSLTDNSKWILGTYKPNVSIMFFFFFTIAHMAIFFIEPFWLMVPKLYSHLNTWFTQQVTVAQYVHCFFDTSYLPCQPF